MRLYLRCVLVLSGLGICFSSRSQEVAAITKKMGDAIARYKDYKIEHERVFKFQSGDDTTTELFRSEVHMGGKPSYTGWHNITNYRYPAMSRLEVANGNGIGILYRDSTYYFNPYSAKSSFHDQTNKGIYKPFLRDRKYYRHYTLLSSSDSFIRLQERDSSTDEDYGIYIVTKTILTIDAKSWLPVSEEYWAWFEGGVEYSRRTLKNIEAINKPEYKTLLHATDSMQRYIKCFRSGDSMNTIWRNNRKKVSEGDPAFMFRAAIYGSKDTFSMAQYKDSIVVLDFFYTACGPCIGAIPYMNSLYEKYKGKGVQFAAVDPYDSDWRRLDKFLTFYTINYPILYAAVSEQYGIEAYPSVLIIKGGKIVKVMVGFSEKMEDYIAGELDKLLKS